MEEQIRIIVGDNGFVWVGYCTDPKNTVFWLTLKNTRTIREWGTTEGLEQLFSGPIEGKTKLDALVPERDIPVRAIITAFLVDQTKWKKHLSPKKSS